MTRWPRSRNARARQSPSTVERMWPTCIGLATFGELKSMTTVRGCAVRWKKRCSPRAGDLDLVAPRAHVESGHDVAGQLARVEPALPGQRHQSVSLVIAKFRIRTG